MSKIIGAIAGDIIGSVYEWHNAKSVADIEFFRDKCRFTDDTVLTCAVAEWIMNTMACKADMEDRFDHRGLIKTLKKYAKKYPYAGYGGMFKKWFNGESDEPMNSFGNGAGMRVSPVGFFCEKEEWAKQWAAASAEVTHNHPEGIKGAQAIACAIVMASNGSEKTGIKSFIEKEFGYDLSKKITDLVNFHCDNPCSNILSRAHKFDATCQVTVPEAIIAFLESKNYEDAIVKAILIGGDSDTIACMTGAIAGAYYGVPEYIEREAMSYLPADLAEVVVNFENFINTKRYVDDKNKESDTEA